MSNAILRAAIAAALVTVGAAQAAPVRTHVKKAVHRTAAPLVVTKPQSVAEPHSVFAVLYDQTAGASTSDYVDSEDSSSDSYDDQAADDFVIPAGQTWAITGLAFNVTAFDFSNNNVPVPGVWTTSGTTQVAIYPNSAGAPAVAPAPGCSSGAAAHSFSGQVLTVTLPTTCTLTAGTYWVSFVATGDFSATSRGYGWLSNAPVTGNGAVWQNPGDGFTTGCTTWSATSCWGSANPDLAFQILGTATPVSLQSFDIQ